MPFQIALCTLKNTSSCSYLSYTVKRAMGFRYHPGQSCQSALSAAGQISRHRSGACRDASPTSWRTNEEAITEVRDSLGPHRVSRMAVDARGEVFGWIGGI